MTIRPSIATVVFLLIFSCGQQDVTPSESKPPVAQHWSDIPEASRTQLIGSPLNLSTRLPIGVAWDMDLCQGKYLLISELPGKDSLVAVVDIERKAVVGYLTSQGNDPSSINHINDVLCSGTDIYLVDANDYSLYECADCDLIAELPLDVEAKMDRFSLNGALVSSALSLGEGRIAAVPMGPTTNSYDTRFTVYEDTVQKGVGPMPAAVDAASKRPIDSVILRSAYEVTSTLSPGAANLYIYLAYKYGSILEAYDSELKRQWIYVAPDAFDPAVAVNDMGGGNYARAFLQDETRLAFTSVTASNTYVYALYGGIYSSPSPSPPALQVEEPHRMVIRIDAKTGKLDRVFELSAPAMRIAVTPDDRMLISSLVPVDWEGFMTFNLE